MPFSGQPNLGYNTTATSAAPAAPAAPAAAKVPALPPVDPANTFNPGLFASYLNGIGNTNQTPGGLLSNIAGTGGFGGSVYGRIPGVANPTGTAATATEGDIGDLTNIANLTQGADTLSAAGAQLPFNLNLPGYEQNLLQDASNVGQELGGEIPGMPGFGKDLATAGATTSQELQGQLPQDVQNQITQQAAERGIATGQGASSQNTNADLLQALGLNSLEQQQQGLKDFGTVTGDALVPLGVGQAGLTNLIGETPTGTSFNPAQQFVSPAEQQAAAQAAQNAQAAPDPGTSGWVSSLLGII